MWLHNTQYECTNSNVDMTKILAPVTPLFTIQVIDNVVHKKTKRHGRVQTIKF